MEMLDTGIGGMLQHLIETCCNSAVGYQAAAEHVQNPALRQLLSEICTQRHNFCEALQQKVHAASLGQTAPPTPAIKTAQKSWLKMKSAVRKGDAAILQVIENAETAMIEVYRETLRDPRLHLVSRMTVQAQYSSVHAAYQSIRTFGETVRG